MVSFDVMRYECEMTISTLFLLHDAMRYKIDSFITEHGFERSTNNIVGSASTYMKLVDAMVEIKIGLENLGVPVKRTIFKAVIYDEAKDQC